MLAAQTVALVVGAALIAASDRLCGAVSSAMRAFVRELPRTLATGAAAAVTAGDQSLRSVLLLAASVSHRPAGQPRPLTDIHSPTTESHNHMTLITGAVPRALILAALTATALFAGTATAWAHVEVDANNTARGGEAILTFQVPNESDEGALTTQFSVALPNVTSASTELMPGWTSRLDRGTAAGIVRSVTWTAAPGVGVPPDQFALFRVAVTLPNTDMVSFPATQTYNDTMVVRWD